MKTKSIIIIISMILTLPMLATNQSPDKDPDKTTEKKIAWDATQFDFETIEVNKQVKHKFSFTNNSDEPIVISRVKSSCGCTVADYEKKPVTPGNAGEVTVAFRSGKPGKFRKSVVVEFGSGEKYFLVVKGLIEK